MTGINELTHIGVSVGAGVMLGAFWMFMVMYKNEQRILEELDAKNKLLNSYEDEFKNKYEDDDYEAY